MKAQQASKITAPGHPKRLLWALPVGLALLFGAYHFWDLRFRPGGTGRALTLVDFEEAQKTLDGNDQAAVLDIRLHGTPSPLSRTLRIPSMELVERIDEIAPYRDAPLFVLAATDEEAAATAAFLARRDFNQVGCIQVDTPPTAHAMADTDTLSLD